MPLYEHFFAGRVSEKNVQVMFFSAGGLLLTIIAIITFTALLFSARKQIKEGTISKKTAQKTYLGSNAALGFGMAHYMFGVIFLILSGLKVFIMPLTDMIPHGFVGGTAALILSVGWVFVLPMYLIGKTPGWLKEILNRF
ncbi:hypothetical protein [Ligilactobacillus acidipiscis]|uniref:hypothetical protein n=1 Tax=Ligilactobacillus acidipiscis TaxID=89059 RepID=UPI0023F6AE45|nr:hypothetical protein [Ligilactobacillus acidipiscis]WEV56412.1 hypothetical protein OZX66_09290 [Ligilactobacillus acidipiscis]